MICPNPRYHRAARDSRRMPAAIILPPHQLYAAALCVLALHDAVADCIARDEQQSATREPGHQGGVYPAITAEEAAMRPLSHRETRRMLDQVRIARHSPEQPQDLPLRWFVASLAMAAIGGMAAAMILRAWLDAGAPL